MFTKVHISANEVSSCEEAKNSKLSSLKSRMPPLTLKISKGLAFRLKPLKLYRKKLKPSLKLFSVPEKFRLLSNFIDVFGLIKRLSIEASDASFALILLKFVMSLQFKLEISELKSHFSGFKVEVVNVATVVVGTVVVVLGTVVVVVGTVVVVVGTVVVVTVSVNDVTGSVDVEKGVGLVIVVIS